MDTGSFSRFHNSSSLSIPIKFTAMASRLWDLGGEKAGTVYSAYRTAVKLIWQCPRHTKTFLMQQVLSGSHTSARTDVLARYGKFVHSLLSSASFEVRVIVRLVAWDLQTVTARNI